MKTNIYDEQCCVCGGNKVLRVSAYFDGDVSGIKEENFYYVHEMNESIAGCHCSDCGIQYFKP